MARATRKAYRSHRQPPGQLSPTALTRLSSTSEGYEAGILPMVAGLMGAADVDHDSILSLAEITTLLLALGVAPGDEATFVTRLDTNDDSVVTLDELVEAFHDYFTSDEPGTIGNSILGPISASDSIR